MDPLKTSIDFPIRLILNRAQIPCIIWLKMRKPKKYGLSWTINIVSIQSNPLLLLLDRFNPCFRSYK
jgi:hypothetical protein